MRCWVYRFCHVINILIEGLSPTRRTTHRSRVRLRSVFCIMPTEYMIDSTRSNAETLRDHRVAQTLGTQFERLFHIEFVSAVHGVISPSVLFLKFFIFL